MPELRDLVVDFVSLVDRAAVRDAVEQSEPMRFHLYKRETTAPEGGSMTPEEKAALDKAQADQKTAETEAATAKADLAKAQEQIEALTKSVEEIKKAAGIEEKPEPIDKSELSPAMRAHVEKMEADAAALADRVAKAERDAEEDRKIAKAEREATALRSFVSKAEKEFPSLPVKADEFGPVLKSASETMPAEQFAELERVLKAGNEAMASVFKEQGRSREGDTADTAVAQAKAAAAEIRKSDNTLSEAVAMQKAFQADPELAARYHDEIRG